MKRSRKSRKYTSNDAVGRIRDGLSQKDHYEKILTVSNQRQIEASRNELYQVQLERSLRRHLRPSLMRLEGAPIKKKHIYECAKVRLDNNQHNVSNIIATTT
jgi:hypothetical protein